ncbi:annexin A3-like isoform X2 [Scleropages formosus]|uniref:annexin A3-like isoform X2 n=1 Tax=Scleropages formosus TaxID=113540 RepID=UPI000878E541|nr:annexin A3 isoform X2 [Scleropages formosus]XP_018592227.1 annexin A3 isoform X2 [Scleropages formosus]
MASTWTTDRGSIKDKSNFNASEDVAVLRKAIEGLGTDEKNLINVLTGRTNKQRQIICKAYQEATGRTLKEDLEGDTSGDFKDLLVALITPPAVYDCQEVIRAIKGAGTTDSTLIEIFASRSTQQIKALSDAYLAETGRKITHDLNNEVSGDYGKALLALAEGQRDERTTVDVGKAKEEAKVLYEAGEKKWGTDESKFIDILCHRSIPQLRQVLIEYKNISGKTLEKSIKSEMSGKLEDLLVAIVKCVQSTPAYLAERLHKGMKGLGTNENMLARIIVSRSEIDMLDIRAEFKKLYSQSLHSALESETSGDYRQVLLKICGGDDTV